MYYNGEHPKEPEAPLKGVPLPVTETEDDAKPQPGWCPFTQCQAAHG